MDLKKVLTIWMTTMLLFVFSSPIHAEGEDVTGSDTPKSQTTDVKEQSFNTIIMVDEDETWMEQVDEALQPSESIHLKNIAEATENDNTSWIIYDIDTYPENIKETLNNLKTSGAQILLLTAENKPEIEEIAKDTESFYLLKSDDLGGQITNFLKENTITVEFYKDVTDTEAIEKTFTTSPSYEGKEKPHMAFPKELYEGNQIGWSEKPAGIEYYKTEALVYNSWIQTLKPRVKLYAVWAKAEETSTPEPTPTPTVEPTPTEEPTTSETKEDDIKEILINPTKEETKVESKTEELIAPEEVIDKPREITLSFVDITNKSANLSDLTKVLEYSEDLDLSSELVDITEKGYELGELPTIEEGNNEYSIELKHQIETKTATKTEEYKRTIHYIFRDEPEKNHDEEQIVTLETITTTNTDVVTQEVTTSKVENWLNGESSWAEIFTPTEEGYTPSESKISKQDLSTMPVRGDMFYNVYYTKMAPKVYKETETPQATKTPGATLQPTTYKDLRGKLVWTLTVMDKEGNVIGYRTVEDGGTAENMPAEYNPEDYSDIHGNKTIYPRITKEKSIIQGSGPLVPYTHDNSHIIRWAFLLLVADLIGIWATLVLKGQERKKYE